MDCPRCNVEMAEIAGDENTAQRCPDCGGIWIDPADLNRVLLHHNLRALSALGGWVNPDEIAGMCPACNVDLVAVEGGERKSLHYDSCESCGGIWLEGPDEDEIAEKIEWKQAAGEIVTFFKAFTKK
ncbi:MAG TPA: zf-TFIIB domain-containing protein [Anaeromyxobacteraceae bacterium]|nr:zf-TFIIB domain-containing protein [Anaeromyxobacteraceae bacterium]